MEDGLDVPISKLCRLFGVPRRTVYYQPTRSAPKVNPVLAARIKTLIEEEPSFGYRTVAGLLEMNKNTVQRIFQLKGWQVRKRPVGLRPRIEALPSVAKGPNERWATDLAGFGVDATAAWVVYRRPSCCGPTTASCSPAAATPDW